MKKLFISFVLFSAPVFAEENHDCVLKAKGFAVEKNATIFWHWDTLYLEIEGHLFYCSELQHSIMCQCFEDNDVE